MMHNAADNAEAAVEMMKHPETVLDGLMDSEEIKQAGRSQYMLFKTPPFVFSSPAHPASRVARSTSSV